ncbi:MAG: sulfatase-like hydrolase/transferase [Cephaloticoccus sp.]|nr:sulfatase-like hydrolase/transferase [Cephaloticoccus sp.]
MALPTRHMPNILLVVADDHRQDCLHGDRVTGPATPTLDSLAAQGTECTGARIMGGDSQAVCVPSRAALLTGCGSRRALANPLSADFCERQRINPNCRTLGEVLGAAGYRTHVVGKWHNDPGTLNRSFNSGEALFLGGMGAHEAPRLHRYDARGNYAPEAAVRTPGFSSELFAEAAIRFIEKAKPGQAPFFLYCAFTSPHDPRTPPADFRARYRDRDLILPENFLARHPFDNGELAVRDEKLAPLPRDPATIRRHRGDYYGMIEHHDHQLGRMLAALEHAGLLEETLIAYVSDHGLALGSHGLLGKQNLYEHSLRVPLIMKGPGIPDGRLVSQDVYAHRLFATLCELAGVSVPETVEVSSLMPLLKGGEKAVADTPLHFAHYFDRQRMVKDERWKLIQYRVNGGRREQLFDLRNDPHELRDLASEPAMQTHLTRLATALRNGPPGLTSW